jgi:hypothetical protein
MMDTPGTPADLVAGCLIEIEQSSAGWFYVRRCFGGFNAGWNQEPLPALGGVVWSSSTPTPQASQHTNQQEPGQ